MENEVRCPKCRSNQLSANKKGFSGKKAVAGAVLTGGIGLVAGTIGSNKIQITCLNCGHTFLPGQGYKEPIHAKSLDDAGLNELDKKVQQIYLSGQKLQAVKVYKDETGIGLKEAKEHVEMLAVGYSPKSSNTGCAGILLLFIIGGALLLLMLK